jgi:hypothetical protein
MYMITQVRVVVILIFIAGGSFTIHIQLSDSITKQRREKIPQNATSDRLYFHITELIPLYCRI